jgi:Glyoxalase/Bleomycin resistance protein/Dioxygenase superfamily
MGATVSPPPLLGVVPTQLGMVVEDLDAGIAELTPLLGCDWQIIRDGETLVPYRTPTGVRELPVRGAETLTGPPYLELLQAIPGSVWEPRGTSYLHHVAYEVPDLPVAADEVERMGYQLLLTQVGPERLHGFGLYRAPSGGLYEIVDAAAIARRRAGKGWSS